MHDCRDLLLPIVVSQDMQESLNTGQFCHGISELMDLNSLRTSS